MKVVSSNPSTIHCIDIYSLIFVIKIVMFVGKTKINEKERGDGPFKATIIACTMPIF